MPLEKESLEKFETLIAGLSTKASELFAQLANKELSISSASAESILADAEVSATVETQLLSFNVAGANNLWLAVPSTTASAIADLMMGGAGDEAAELDDTKQAAFIEAIKQVMTSLVSALKEENEGLDLDLGELQSTVLNPEDNASLAKPEGVNEPNAVSLSLEFEDKSLPMSLEINSILAEKLISSISSEAGEGAASAEFATINSAEMGEVDEGRNLDLLMDIKMGLIVELGRAEMPLKDILKLTKGSVIELDRLSGEPVDLFVNNKLVARGEVVVIDDNFGLRITQLAGNITSGQDLGLFVGNES